MAIDEQKPEEQADFEVGQGDQITPDVMETTEEATPEDIGARLSQTEGADVEDTENASEAASPLPIDIGNLSVEQLQSLKQALAATPDTRRRSKVNPIISLRRMDGKLIIDYKPRAFKALVHDSVERRDKEVYMISVMFHGTEKFVDVNWQEFIEAPRIPCEVVGSRRVPEEIVEGETISRETNQPVEMVKIIYHDWFTIKLPEEEGAGTLEIEARIANA